MIKAQKIESINKQQLARKGWKIFGCVFIFQFIFILLNILIDPF